MTTRVVTLMWGTAWERYGRAFAASFARHWPADVELVVVTDQLRPIPRGRQVMLNCIPSWNAFRGRWGEDRRAQGFGCRHPKRDAEGRCWRCHALKWAPQGIAPRECLSGLDDGDLFVWLDADVETVAPVPEGWVDGLIGDADVACLQRPRQHSEIGFYAMRMNGRTRAALHRFGETYASGDVFRLPEFHSAFVWDHAVASVPKMKVRSLTPPGRRGHVWPHTALARYTRHKKGKLKDAA